MKRWPLILLFLGVINSAFADCDLTQFRWGCDMPAVIKPAVPRGTSLVLCGHTFVYLSQAQYDLLSRYTRANDNMSLDINGERLDGPCIPADR